jgi:hypothetical protein
MNFFLLLALASATAFDLPEDTEYTAAMAHINAATAEIDTARAKVVAAADKVREMVPSRGATADSDLGALVEETSRSLFAATKAVRAAVSPIQRKHAMVLHTEAHCRHKKTKKGVLHAEKLINTERSTEQYVAELDFKKLLCSWAVTDKTVLVADKVTELRNAEQKLSKTLEVEKKLKLTCASARITLDLSRENRSNKDAITTAFASLNILENQLNDAIHNTFCAEKERDAAKKSHTDASQYLTVTKHFLMEAETALSEKQHQLEKDRSNAQHAFEEAYIIAYHASFATVYGQLG